MSVNESYHLSTEIGGQIMQLKEALKFITNIKHFKGLFRKSIATIESIENPYEDYYVIKLATAPGFTWNPGEHGIFKLIGKDIKGTDYRLFSVASIPEEGYILLGIRTGKEPSSYKKELISMKKGEKVSLSGPFGWFKLMDRTSPLVLFASGVGITPIRALLKELENDMNRPVEVVYASYQFYLFEEEIERIVNNNPKITLHKTVTPEETQHKLTKLATQYGNNAYYYNSGAPAVLESVKTLLNAKGINDKRIVDDTLKGY